MNEPTWYSGIVVRSDDNNELANTICIEVTWYCVNIFPCHVDVKLSVAKYPTSKITPAAQVVMSKEKNYGLYVYMNKLIPIKNQKRL